MPPSLKVSVVLLAYQQENFVREAIEGLFSQDEPPSEIVLSDDCSKDGTFRIMEEMAGYYDGSANLILRRNDQNLGISEHVNQVMMECSGDVIVLCAGDDVSLPRRVSITRKCFEQNGKLAALSLRQQAIDGSGKYIGKPAEVPSDYCKVFDYQSYMLGLTKHPSAASRAYRRNVFDIFGPLNKSCPSEDTPMLVRAMLVGRVQEIADIGILYRRHSNNLSNPGSVQTMDLNEIKQQQSKDLGRALESGLLDAKRFDQYGRLLDSYWARRRLSAAVVDQPVVTALQAIMSETRMSVRERFGISARLLRRRARSRFST